MWCLRCKTLHIGYWSLHIRNKACVSVDVSVLEPLLGFVLADLFTAKLFSERKVRFDPKPLISSFLLIDTVLCAPAVSGSSCVSVAVYTAVLHRPGAPGVCRDTLLRGVHGCEGLGPSCTRTARAVVRISQCHAGNPGLCLGQSALTLCPL